MKTPDNTQSIDYTYLMLEHLPMGVALLGADDFSLLSANTTYFQIHEEYLDAIRRNESIIGYSIIDWLPQQATPKLVTARQAVLATGIYYKVDEEVFPSSVRGLTYWNWSLSPIRDSEGRINHLLLVFNEVTSQVLARGHLEMDHASLNRTNQAVEAERKRLEVIETSAVENEHARLQAVLDQLPEGVLLIEASGQRISYANTAAAHILGVPITEIGRLPTSEYPPTSFSIKNSNAQRIAPEDYIYVHALHGKTISGQEIFLTRPDGTKAVVLSSATPIRAENNVIREAVVVFQDITERKSIEQHKNEFVSIASHELRTPITAIQGFAELLEIFLSQSDNQAPQRSLQAIKSIMEQSQRLARLIEAMLDLARIENVQLLINPAMHNLLATITHTVKTQAITSKRHTIRLILDGLQPGDRLMAYYDEDRIDQVLNNLISNATKYSSPGSEIEVGLSFTEKKSREALIWVKDHGVGIASSELPHIFKRFHRASNFDRSISGLGIGLYLVHELMTRHGGKVWAESIEGHGSTFYVTLPLFTGQI